MSSLKINTILALAAGFLTVASPANATDIFGGSAKDDPGYAGPVAVNWSGFYIGGAIGYGNANHDLSVRDYFKDYCGDSNAPDDHGIDDPDKDNRIDYLSEAGVLTCEKLIRGEGGPVVDPDHDNVLVPGDSREVASLDGLNSTGIVGDVRLGYDQQFGRFVFGVFGSYGLSNMEADGTNTLFGDSFTFERGDDWSVGARVGKLLGERTLLYILAAYTQTEYELNAFEGEDSFSKTTTFDGITVGGGLEYALASNVFLGIEGTHTFYDGENIFDVYDPLTNEGIAVHDDLGETKIMGTLKIKLNSGLFGN